MPDNIAIAKKDFAKSVNDVQNNNSPQKQGQSSGIKIMLTEFLQEQKLNDLSLKLSMLQHLYSQNSTLFSQFDPQTTAQPPEMIMV